MNIIRFIERRSSRSCDLASPHLNLYGPVTGVWFWHSIALGDLSGRSALLEKLLRFPVPNTFIVDPKQSVTGIVCVGERVAIVRDISADAIPHFFRFDTAHSEEPIAVVKRPMGESETTTSFMDAQTLTQFLRRIHESEDSSILCIQEFIRSRTSQQFVRVTYAKSTWSGIVMSSHTPRVFKLSNSAIDGDLRELAESVLWFIENFFRVHLSQIVVDCVKSTTSSWILLQVKSVIVDRPALTVAHQSATMSCKVRCSICKDHEVSKLVTSRMIKDCHKNLVQRNCEISGLIARLDLLASKGSTKCCDECYTLIMNELELGGLSELFGRKISSLMCDTTAGEFWRLFVYVQGFSNCPSDFDSLSNVQISCFDESMNFVTSERKINLFNITNIYDFENTIIRITAGSFSGSVDCVSTLLARSRMSPNEGQCNQYKVFLGKEKFHITLFVGLCWHQGPLSASQFIPLPDQWISVIKSRSGRKRSISNSRRLCVRS